MSTKIRAAAALTIAFSVVLMGIGSSAAYANHNRATGTQFTVTGDVATWTVTTAWRADDASSLVSDTIGDQYEIEQLTSYSDSPNSGVGTGVWLTLGSYTSDSSNPLYDTAVEVLTGDISALTDGIYELYADSCCTIDMENSPFQNFAEWVRFTKTGTSYNIAPITTGVTPMQFITLTGDTTIDFTATDTEAVSYSLVTDTADPLIGYTDVPCSDFVGAVFTVGPSHCTGVEDWATDMVVGGYWGVRVLATDATGNESTTTSLLHVFGPPDPYIDSIDLVSGRGILRFEAYESNGEVVDSWTIECTNVSDAGDVVTGTGTTGTLVIPGFTVGQDYACSVTASNAAGTGQNGTWGTGIVIDHYLELTTTLAVGQTLSGKTVTVTGRDVYDGTAWTLIQMPESALLATDFADPAGDVDQAVVMPTSACVAGAHVLTVTGVGNSNDPLTDSLWYTLDANCVLTTLSFTAPSAGALAATGFDVTPLVPAGGALAVLAGLALLFVRRREAAQRS
jgi:hypothetical protein